MNKPTKASRELDALVAEKVLGWRWVRADPKSAWLTKDMGKKSGVANRLHQGLAWMVGPDAWPSECAILADASGKNIINTAYKPLGTPGSVQPYYDGGEWPDWGMPPEVSTDIAAAWMVVDRLVGDQYERKFELEGLSGRTAPGRWWAYFYKGLDRFSGHGEDAPLAICLAALKAVGGMKNGK